MGSMWGKDPPPPPSSFASKPPPGVPVIDRRENFPVTSHFQLTPRVNVITGENLEEEQDLVIAGSDPLSLRRFYGHQVPYYPYYSQWRFNPEHFCTANFSWGEQEYYVSVGERDGSVHSYKKYEPHLSRFSAYHGSFGSFVHLLPNGGYHPLNTRIHFRSVPSGWQSSWEGEITQGDGTQKSFKTMAYVWTYYLKPPHNGGPSEARGRRGEGWISPNVWTPYQLPLVEERKPNGNRIVYKYDSLNGQARYPVYYLPTEMIAYNATKTKVMGSLRFRYNSTLRTKNFEVEGSDQRKVVFTVKSGEIEGHYISSVSGPCNPYTEYNPTKPCKRYWGPRLQEIVHPEGRTLFTEYDIHNKVKTQYAHVGPPGREFVPIAQYNYLNNQTEVMDAEGNKLVYFYDENKRFTKIISYDKSELVRVDHYAWDFGTGNLISKESRDGHNHLLFREEHEYDSRQNVIVERRKDEKESTTLYRKFSEDGFNLLLEEWDDFGKKIRYVYLPNTNLLTAEFQEVGGQIRKRKFHFYDDCAICLKTIVDDGVSENPQDLFQVTYRRITEVQPRYTLPCFGLAEEVREKTIDARGNELLLSMVRYRYTPFGAVLQEDHYDATATYRYSIFYEYDHRERVIAKIDSSGKRTSFTYDANNNLLTAVGPREDKWQAWTYDLANRPIKMQDDNGITKKRAYDKLGRVVASWDEAGFQTQYVYNAAGNLLETLYADGTRERKEYDALGNIVKEVDGEGYVTTRRYNFRGQVTSINYPDGGEESFTYRGDGKLLQHTDKNGALRRHVYDAFGNCIQEQVCSMRGEVLKETTALYSPFTLLSTTDPEGVETHYSYDYAGRKIAMSVGGKKTLYTYDSLGRVSSVQMGERIEKREYDLLDHLIEKRGESLSGEVLEQQNYSYDALGNQTEVRNSKGVFETRYNTLGQPILIKDPLGNSRRVDYTYQQQLIKTETFPKGVQKVTYYDCRGRESALVWKNKEGACIHKKRYCFDGRGNVTQSIEEIFEGTSYQKESKNVWSYGPCDQVLKFVECDSREIGYAYDERGRLKRIKKADGVSIHYEYDTCGRLIHYFSKDFDYVYTYDGCDRIVSVVDAVSKTVTLRVYDSLGNVLREKLGNGLTLQNRYDEQGKRVECVLPDSTSIYYAYQDERLYQVRRKNYSHTYAERDFEGKVTSLVLPGGLGAAYIERDALSRWQKFTSSFYTALFPEESYDAHGNLCSYTYVDLLGSDKLQFTYDDFDQLTSEKGHTYVYDSYHNRLKRDEVRLSLNAQHQVVSGGREYDKNGNLVKEEGRSYRYDSQDRLIEVCIGKLVIAYTYDPFHRRLTKECNKRRESFIWDGQNEIGLSNEKGKIEQLRVLGESLGAEIGAAVLFELEGREYVPVHDYRGSLVTLVELGRGRGVEVYRYTAFGEAVVAGKRAPWRFSSKRYEEETRFYYFGRRYYDPGLGRWITLDPQGLKDGVNRYAYVKNNPLTYFDLYGLRREANPHSRESREGGCQHDFSHFEDRYRNKSYSMDFPGRADIKNLGTGFCNGMYTEEQIAKMQADHIMKLTDEHKLRFTYNATHGPVTDIVECILNLYLHKLTPPALELMRNWNEFFTKNPEGYYLQYAFSQGGILVRNALRHTPEHISNRIMVVAIASAAYIHKDLCLEVRHYVSPGDIVPKLDWVGKTACADTTFYLNSHENPSLKDHCLMNPIYDDPIRDSFEHFIKNYGEEKR